MPPPLIITIKLITSFLFPLLLLLHSVHTYLLNYLIHCYYFYNYLFVIHHHTCTSYMHTYIYLIIHTYIRAYIYILPLPCCCHISPCNSFHDLIWIDVHILISFVKIQKFIVLLCSWVMHATTCIFLIFFSTINLKCT